MQKRILIILGFVLAMVATVITPALAAPVSPDQARVVKFWIGKTYYEVDGQRKTMDVAPYVEKDRTMMPIRYLAESLGPNATVEWNPQSQQVTAKRGTDVVSLHIGNNSMDVGFLARAATLELPPVLKDGRTMLPYRAVAQALGALVFWDNATQCVTVETWKELPPPVKQTVKKVTVYKNQKKADVVGLDGKTETVTTDRPAMTTDNPNDPGFTLDVVEWFKLWGIPESAMLYDPVRGGIAIRGSAYSSSSRSAGYIYFYNGDKYCWDNGYAKSSDKSTVNNITGKNEILNGRFCSDWPAELAVADIFNKSGPGSFNNSTGSLELN